MGTKPSIFQPDHSGKTRQVPVHDGMTVSHVSHGQGDHATGHAVKGNIARDGAPKRIEAVAVHGGMSRTTNGNTITGGGHAASALDSLTGATVPAARNTAQAGWGNKGVRDGNPTAKPPGPQKKLTRVAPAFGMRSRTNEGHQSPLHELGEAVLDAAFSASTRDDQMAHRRPRRLPDTTRED
jgi:hypothetical protein